MTKPTVHRFASREALIAAAAADSARRIADAIAARGEARVALAGGSTPRPVYERLATPELASTVSWDRVEVFFGDERCVPPEHASSNWHMAWEALLRHVPIPQARLHRIEGELAPAEAAARYAQALGETPLDVVVLGMGDDGHTASLFPGRPELDDTAARVVAARGPAAPFERVSLGLRTLCEAHSACFWVAGADKAERVAQVLAQAAGPEPELPAARVRPAGELSWLLDAAAAAKL